MSNSTIYLAKYLRAMKVFSRSFQSLHAAKRLFSSSTVANNNTKHILASIHAHAQTFGEKNCSK
jgi:hypothetical protein